MAPEIIITGTGRCGTNYFARVLTEVGIPCTHEGYFTPEGPSPVAMPRADSSWLAAPYLGSYPEAKLIMAVRSPQAVVRSLMGVGFFEIEGPFRKFALCHEPDLSGKAPLEACWLWWTRWNRRILAHDPGVVVGVTDMMTDWVPPLASTLGVEKADLRLALDRLPATNSRRRYKRPILSADPDVMRHALDLWDHLRS